MSLLEEGVRIGGHPVHTMLVHFPIGLCIGSVALDVGALALQKAAMLAAADIVLELGLISLTPVLVTGFVDYVAVARARAGEVTEVATRHMLAAFVGGGAFVASWLARRAGLGAAVYVTLGLVGAASFAVAGRLGGRMILEFGVGAPPRKERADDGAG